MADRYFHLFHSELSMVDVNKVVTWPTSNTHSYAKHIEMIKKAIAKGNGRTLQDLLYYKVPSEDVKYNNDGYAIGGRNNDDIEVDGTYTLKATYFAEWLYQYKREDFRQIILAIINSNEEHRENLADVFSNVFNATDVNVSLFELDDNCERLIKIEILKLEHHGAKLEADKESEAQTRGTIVTSLAKSLLTKLNSYKENAFHEIENEGKEIKHAATPPASLQKNIRKLCDLNFKLNFINLLHSKDKAPADSATRGLINHRDKGLAIILSNLASLIFTGCLANLLLGIATGRWYFFKQTQTQTHTDNMQRTLGVSKASG